ncbi:hypothetical protein NDU88_006513 [Pleurodeles waltl]|uniref:Uncharacterized protein n=1 Tax=Pleurodeles waltl TaxID=8319 RepID=A0AAV7TYL6_PLEWA|nr:hypothetical protein NDU88_006513 [Pleurodeles waltl]
MPIRRGRSGAQTLLHAKALLATRRLSSCAAEALKSSASGSGPITPHAQVWPVSQPALRGDESVNRAGWQSFFKEAKEVTKSAGVC